MRVGQIDVAAKASSNSRVLRCAPRRSYFSVRAVNQRSTRLIHEAPVGVKCRWKRRVAREPSHGVGRRKQRRRAVPRVIVDPPLDMAGTQGQDGLAPVERLNLSLFVDTQDQGFVGRLGRR